MSGPVAERFVGDRCPAWRFMQRVLDLDLDFFVQEVVHNAAAEASRADSRRHEVSLGYDTMLDDVDVDTISGTEAALAYMRERFALHWPLPGAAVQDHREVFTRWQEEIANGTLRTPFHVTHADAHGDFGYGQISHELVLAEGFMALPQVSEESVSVRV